ncbi:MAG: FtsH protease activity modulator HflK [Clostridia bacterium]|jgi:membrane protease subunit HflK|nr:FtsH protease activity modulator HflK [Clostridia bacterium]MBQ2385318.1 FtsH protease activity modulator HflK [Clostridia bacterium]
MKKKNAVFEDVLSTVTKYFIVLVVVVVLFICFSGVRFVKSGEVAIVLRFGKLVGETRDEQIHEPGILFAFPYIIDEVVTVPTETVMERTVTTHYTEGNMTTLRNNGYVITGDSNIAVMKVSVKYTISDPVAYALNVNSIEKIIDASVSNAMLEKAAASNFDDILTTGKEEYSTSVKNMAQSNLNTYNAGIALSTVELTNVAAPEEVRLIYEQVNTASVEAEKMLKEANQYRDNLLIKARAEANSTVSAASSAKSQAVSSANADLASFWGMLEEYEANPEVVTTRVYSEKFSAILSKIGKIYVVKDGDNTIIIN